MGTPDSIGPYLVTRTIGTGGMGRVFEVRHSTRTRERYALKTLRNEEDERVLSKFLKEARLGAILDHPNVVRTLEVGRDRDRVFIVMELLEGETLSALCPIPGEPLPEGMVVAVALQILAGLEHAHQAEGPDGKMLGIVHRDIKRSNLFLTEQGVVKLIDFGVARDLDSTRSTGLTGTLPYLAPEQIRGEQVDPRSDLFSLGLVLHEMLTGRRVFNQKNEATILSAILWLPIPAPSSIRPDVSPALNDALRAALEKDPSQRPPSAAALAALLRQSLPAEAIWSNEQLAHWLQARRGSLRDEPNPGTVSVASESLPELTAHQVRTEVAVPPRRAALAKKLGLAGVLCAAVAVALIARTSGSDDASGEQTAQAARGNPPIGADEHTNRAAGQNQPTLGGERNARGDAPTIRGRQTAQAKLGDALSGDEGQHRAAVQNQPTLGDEQPTEARRGDAATGIEEQDRPGAEKRTRAKPGEPSLGAGQQSAPDKRPAIAGRRTDEQASGSKPPAARTTVASRVEPRLAAERSGRKSPPPAAPKQATLKVHIHPWGQVFVNDREVPTQKRMDAQLTLAPGRYRLKAVNPHLGERRKDIVLTDGQRFEWQVDFDE
jgi:serine/threonine-protein kinase